MKIVVLGGAGMMGREAVRDLSLMSRQQIDQIVVADTDIVKAKALCTELDDSRLSATVTDARDPEALATLLRGARLVLNATTFHHGVTVTEAAIEARVDYVDLGGLMNTPKQLSLDRAANSAGVLVCLGAGCTPGLSNVLARIGANSLDTVDEIAIHFGSFRSIAPSPGLLDTVLDEFSPDTRRFFFRAGALIDVGAFEGQKTVRFEEPVGEQATFFVPHSEVHTLPRSIRGVSLVSVRGCWQAEIMEALRALHRFGLLQGPVKAAIRTQLLQNPTHFAGEWAFLLRIEVVGTKAGAKVRQVLTTTHPRKDVWGETATARMTGIPASVAAQLICAGTARGAGVKAADECFDPEVFVAELKRRDIHVHQRQEAA